MKVSWFPHIPKTGICGPQCVSSSSHTIQIKDRVAHPAIVGHPRRTNERSRGERGWSTKLIVSHPFPQEGKGWGTHICFLFRRGGIDDAGDFADPIGREAALLSVLADGLLAVGDVDAVDLVGGDEALHPLNVRAHVADDATGVLRDGLQLFRLRRADVRNVSLDNILWHGGDCTTGTPE